MDTQAIHGAVVKGDGSEKDGITRRNADFVNRWIAARTLGGAEPEACTPWAPTSPDGKAVKCPSLPSNDD
jgi:hypothetical protein